MSESKNILEPSKRELRSYGLMMSGVVSFFTALFVYKGVYFVSGVLGVIMVTFFWLGLAAPKALVGTHRRWMKLAQVLGAFNLRIILGFIYLTSFTLVRLTFLVTGKDPMRRKFDANAKTYWLDHQEPDNDPKRYERLY